MPALLTSTSRRRSRSSARSTSDRAWAGSPRPAWRARWPPPPRAATVSSAACRAARNWTATVAPWAANRSATARPIPREPPVTSTTMPSKSTRTGCLVPAVDVGTYRLTLNWEEEDPMGTELEGAGGYRVGDADRNRTADLLKEAHAAGYLTLEE